MAHDEPARILAPVGTNPVRLWGLTAEARLRRMAAARSWAVAEDGALIANLRFVFDPAWLGHLAARPGTVLTREGEPVLAHLAEPAARARVAAAMAAGDRLPDGVPGVRVLAQEAIEGLEYDELRKRERPFAERLTAATVPAIERQSYVGAYKGVTDLLTKYLWPEWALWLTRIAARAGITPNQVTIVGALLCVAATIAFYHGWFWTGLATGLGFMVLDTVDGKLARVTITASRLGEVLDHGMDLVHPPFWWVAWGIGCAAVGRALDPASFAVVMGVIIGGYVVQRLIEGAFILRFGIHIHVWRRFDSRFRLVTARRNPNMVILFASLLVGRPDIGIVAVAWWTAISLLVHGVQLAQALRRRAAGRPVRSWLAEDGVAAA